MWTITFTDIVIAIAAVISALFGILTFFVYVRMHGIMTRQADIADNQRGIMQAQADLEPPRLFCIIRDQNFIAVTSSLSAALYTTFDAITMNAAPQVVFGLRNYGRSPAILRHIKAKVARQQVAPNEETSYVLTDLPPERVLGKDEITSDVSAMMSIFKGPLKRSEYNMLLRGQTYWWFFGTVGFDDVWGNKNVFHFCWRYDQGVRVFDPYPPERNYTEHMKATPHGTPLPP